MRWLAAMMVVVLLLGASGPPPQTPAIGVVVAVSGFTITTNAESVKIGSTGTTTVHTFTGLAANTLIVISCASEDAANGGPTFTIADTAVLTWTRRSQAPSTANSGYCEIQTALFAAGGSSTVTCTYSAVGQRRSTVAYLITGQNASQTFTNSSVGGQSTPSITMNNAVASAKAILVTSDFAAIDPGAGPTYDTTPTHTKTVNDFQSTHYTGYHYRVEDCGATGAKTYGITTPSTMNLASTCGVIIIP